METEECSPATFDTCMISEILNLDEFLRQKCFQGRQVETRQFFCTKIESTFPCRVVYVKTRNEFVSLYSRAVDPKRGNFLVKLNSCDYCSNINVKINTNFGVETGLRKATRKKCYRHVSFLIHTVSSS